MEYVYIATTDSYYPKAVTLRITAFFKGMKDALALINDADEAIGIHLVTIDNQHVIGTGRLNIKEKTAIISQMAIDPMHRNQGIGHTILSMLMEQAMAADVTTIELSARKTAISFYEKKGFIPTGTIYRSAKTGILHQKMTYKVVATNSIVV